MTESWYDKQVIEYRNRKPNCRWCKYYRYRNPLYLATTWEECRLKDKWIKEKKIRARLCKCYKQKEFEE